MSEVQCEPLGTGFLGNNRLLQRQRRLSTISKIVYMHCGGREETAEKVMAKVLGYVCDKIMEKWVFYICKGTSPSLWRIE